jgi:hypothetical protein
LDTTTTDQAGNNSVLLHFHTASLLQMQTAGEHLPDKLHLFFRDPFLEHVDAAGEVAGCNVVGTGQAQFAHEHILSSGNYREAASRLLRQRAAAPWDLHHIIAAPLATPQGWPRVKLEELAKKPAARRKTDLREPPTLVPVAMSQNSCYNNLIFRLIDFESTVYTFRKG